MFLPLRMQSVFGSFLFAATLSVIGACATPASAPTLPEGTWTGALTPMNHPEMANPVTYDVRYPEGTLAIDLIGPDDSRIATRAVRLTADSLHYTFDEPEEGITLQCALGRRSGGHFDGRCTDAAGQWARFTMVPPAPTNRR